MILFHVLPLKGICDDSVIRASEEDSVSHSGHVTNVLGKTCNGICGMLSAYLKTDQRGQLIKEHACASAL